MIRKITQTPNAPGVYVFKNTAGAPIYIGKARNLKSRIRTYFQKKARDWKTDILMPEAADLDWIPTKTETEALLLEAELVRTQQPKFNVLLKDGQPFVYLVITKEKLPQLKMTRNKKEIGTYWGPFIHKAQTRSVYNFLLDTFSLRVCNKKITHGCLQYHLGHCSGSCLPNFDQSAYEARLAMAKQLLQGKTKSVRRELAQRIAQSNKSLTFEQSKVLHAISENLDYIIDVIKLHFDPTHFQADIERALAAKSESAPNQEIATQLQLWLNLEKKPHSIDCFDISHIQSHEIVGSCVRFVDGLPDKNKLRKFKIKTLVQQDDYSSLREIIERRYRTDDLPDLILVDGGKGQLNAVAKLCLNVPIISLAKGPDRVYTNDPQREYTVTPKTLGGRTLIALRDYAHRTAIMYHRHRRRTQLKDQYGSKSINHSRARTH